VTFATFSQLRNCGKHRFPLSIQFARIGLRPKPRFLPLRQIFVFSQLRKHGKEVAYQNRSAPVLFGLPELELLFELRIGKSGLWTCGIMRDLLRLKSQSEE
jgi:hypothetical protein